MNDIHNFDLDDDRPIGRILSRREALALIGAGAGATIVAACMPGALTSLAPSTSPAAARTPVAAIPACIVKPELTEGPYFVDERLDRSDIRADTNSGTVEEGIPLSLAFAVSKLSGVSCTAFQGALLDVWHCNAAGEYSDVQQNNTVGQNFLRGYQLTDASGSAWFTTVYPGWYRGRTVHIHFKIRTDPDASSGLEFTSQLFFDEQVNDEVFAQAPYSSHTGRDMTNDRDSIYSSELLLVPTSSGSGYAATFAIGVVA